jgi:hypothetical protein
MLASFINKRKVRKISLFDAAFGRGQSPSSIASFSCSGPSEGQQSSLDLSTPSFFSVSEHNLQSSPRLFLDLTEESPDWFPHEILTGHMKRSDIDLPRHEELNVVLPKPEIKKVYILILCCLFLLTFLLRNSSCHPSHRRLRQILLPI